MRALDGPWLLSLPALLGAGAISFLACGPPPEPLPPPGGQGAGGSATSSSGGAAPNPDGGSGAGFMALPGMPPASTDGTIPECRLPAPHKSADACKTDADCGVSEPCHAHECVGKSRSRPPDAQTICTQIMDCHSADRNPCVCLEGVCALVPPKE